MSRFEEIVGEHRGSMAVIGERLRAVDELGSTDPARDPEVVAEPPLKWDGRILRSVTDGAAVAAVAAFDKPPKPGQRRTNWLT